MSNAQMPERIWAWQTDDNIGSSRGWNTNEGPGRVAFVRSDLCASGQQVRAVVSAILTDLHGALAFRTGRGDEVGYDNIATGISDSIDIVRRIALTPAPQPEGNGFIPSLTPAQRTIHDALCTSQYRAGLKAGWNAGCIKDDDKAQAEYDRLIAGTDGYMSGYQEAKHRLALTPAPDAAQTEDLEWVKNSIDWQANTPFGEYIITVDLAKTGGTCYLWCACRDMGEGYDATFRTVTEAKKAAQADYDKRRAVCPTCNGWSQSPWTGKCKCPAAQTEAYCGCGDKACTACFPAAPAPGIAEAAKVLLEGCPNPIFDRLKPIMMGEVKETVEYTDEDGDEASYELPVSWTNMKKIIAMALRALANGESHG